MLHYTETIVVSDEQLASLKQLGADGPDSRLGIPRLAPPDIAQCILERMQRLSRDLGTQIDIEGTVGVITVK